MMRMCVVALAWVLCCCSAWAQDVAQKAADEYEQVGFEQRLGSTVDLGLTFRDSDGSHVTLREMMGEGVPVVLSLVYYECPMLCTLILNGMSDCFRQLKWDAGNEFRVITVSFDHEETHLMAAEKKDAYLDAYDRDGTEEGWRFLVGEKEEVAALAEAIGFQFRYDPETDEFAHRSGIVVLTPKGKVSRYFSGVTYTERDMRFGLIDASSGKIGSFIDKVFMLCYHYDPSWSDETRLTSSAREPHPPSPEKPAQKSYGSHLRRSWSDECSVPRARGVR